MLAKVGWARAIPLRVLLGWTQRSIQLRERARLKQALLYSRLRRVALAIGDDLCADGRLERRDDVFMLTFDELDALLAGGAMFPDHLAADDSRAACTAHAGALRHASARQVRACRRRLLAVAAASAAGAAVERDVHRADPRLTGTSACGGRATARATVLADVTEAHKLHAGDILVTRQTDPGWGPVFPLIAGLVMERGGMLSHGAIIAREFGIPSIVGVADATRLIPHGAMVCLDGDRGTVAACRGRTPSSSKASLLLAYARERLTPGRLLPAVLLVVAATLAGRGWSGGTLRRRRAASASLLVIAFRIWDDLVDRDRDRATHPERVAVRAASHAAAAAAAVAVAGIAALSS